MKNTIISILIGAALIAGSIILAKSSGDSDQEPAPNQNNVSVVLGKQIVEITARGGYFPKTTLARADMPTVIKVVTQSTFDCSSALTIPSIGYRSYLPNSGETLIEVPPQKPGTTLQGLCSMGMYRFQIKFN